MSEATEIVTAEKKGIESVKRDNGNDQANNLLHRQSRRGLETEQAIRAWMRRRYSRMLHAFLSLPENILEAVEPISYECAIERFLGRAIMTLPLGALASPRKSGMRWDKCAVDRQIFKTCCVGMRLRERRRMQQQQSRKDRRKSCSGHDGPPRGITLSGPVQY